MQTRLALFCCLCVVFFSPITLLRAQETGQDEVMPGPYIRFDEDTYDFGEVEMGDVLRRVFPFQNVGDQPLILADVLVTCGCTVPDWPQGLIMPGQRSQLEVVFDTEGKSGSQNKVITVKSNANNDSVALTIRANVIDE